MEEPPSRRRVSVINRSGRKLRTTPIQKAAELALAHERASSGDVCILLTDDEELQDLNRTYRRLDEPTDVLTFPAEFGSDRKPKAEGRIPNLPLGDIAIAVPYAERQAQLRGIALDHELQYLAIHGVLHLLGFDDKNEAQRAEMFAEMYRIGEQAGLPPEPEWSSLGKAPQRQEPLRHEGPK